MTAKTWILEDRDQDLYIEQIALGPDDVEGTTSDFSVTKRSLRAGLSRGVDLIEVDNGTFRFTVIPTRGMGIWKASLGQLQLAWNAPANGPVHPAFVPLNESNGLGWLDGFDEWLVRCGLESNGAPEFDDHGRLRYNLHGKIANIPAHKVEVSIDATSGEIAVRGTVDETRLFGNKLRMVSTITTQLGHPGMTVHDTVSNLSAEEGELELLYHINFGPPLAGPGAKILLPVAKLAPRDTPAVEELPTWDTCGPPTPNRVETVFFTELLADADGRTHAMIRNAAGDQAVSLRYDTSQLPCLTLWKNHQAEADGYVTGLEPAVNLPNIRSFEKCQGRVAVLSPGQSRDFAIDVEVHPDVQSVRAAEQAVAAIQQRCSPQVYEQPQPDWSSG